jgi:RND family efflux transporter MFP subunit
MRSPMVLVVLVVVLFAGCGDARPETPAVVNAAPVLPATPPPAKPIAENTETVISASGPIIVEHQVEVTAQREGILEKIYFDAPAHVRAGTLLAKLDDRQITANLEAARAKSRSIADDVKNWEAEAQVLQADYGRAQSLWNLGLISKEQLEHAQYKAESDQWDIRRVTEMLNTAHEEERALELELDKTKIVAPFDGVIARRYVREGQNVVKGDRLFWVTAEAPLLMRFTLPEKYFGRIHQGREANVTSADAPGEEHTARVKEISPVVDPSSGTFEVLVELTGSRGSLRPGMSANVRLADQR